jgi:tetratricopeptide (TPR) repeat protein
VTSTLFQLYFCKPIRADSQSLRPHSIGLLLIFATCVLFSGCARWASQSDVIHIDDASLASDGGVTNRRGIALYSKGKLEAAQNKFEKATSQDPMDGAARNNLGLVYLDQRRLVLAANEFWAASELRPHDPRPLNGLGMTLEAGGRVDEALDLYAQAYELAPENPLYLGNFVRLLTRLGHDDFELQLMMEELAFIETRPEWLEWVDAQLALFKNHSLERINSDTNNPLDGRRRLERKREEIDAKLSDAPESEGRGSLGRARFSGSLQGPDEPGTEGLFLRSDENELDRGLPKDGFSIDGIPEVISGELERDSP